MNKEGDLSFFLDLELEYRSDYFLREMEYSEEAYTPPNKGILSLVDNNHRGK